MKNTEDVVAGSLDQAVGLPVECERRYYANRESVPGDYDTASFRQKREGLDEYVEGYGERIEYDTRAETVDFYVQARIKRNMDEVRGEHITYSAKTEIFQVNGGTGAESDPPKRVRAILQPRQKQDAAAP